MNHEAIDNGHDHGLHYDPSQIYTYFNFTNECHHREPLSIASHHDQLPISASPAIISTYTSQDERLNETLNNNQAQMLTQYFGGKNERCLCEICGDISAGFHCNAYVCEACKKFFVRSSKNENYSKYICSKINMCEINKDTRTHCQKCRFFKCLKIGMVLPGSVIIPSADISIIPCRVCGAKSSGFHFGAITCEGCKGFFRRTVNERDNQRYSCRNGGNCQITLATRNNCKSCRFHKCLTVGMSKDGSRIGRQPNSIKHLCAIEIEQIKSNRFTKYNHSTIQTRLVNEVSNGAVTTLNNESNYTPYHTPTSHIFNGNHTNGHFYNNNLPLVNGMNSHEHNGYFLNDLNGITSDDYSNNDDDNKSSGVANNDPPAINTYCNSQVGHFQLNNKNNTVVTSNNGYQNSTTHNNNDESLSTHSYSHIIGIDCHRVEEDDKNESSLLEQSKTATQEISMKRFIEKVKMKSKDLEYFINKERQELASTFDESNMSTRWKRFIMNYQIHAIEIINSVKFFGDDMMVCNTRDILRNFLYPIMLILYSTNGNESEELLNFTREETNVLVTTIDFAQNVIQHQREIRRYGFHFTHEQIVLILCILLFYNKSYIFYFAMKEFKRQIEYTSQNSVEDLSHFNILVKRLENMNEEHREILSQYRDSSNNSISNDFLNEMIL